MLSLWANWLVTKFGLNSLKRYLWPVLYILLYLTFCRIMWGDKGQHHSSKCRRVRKTFWLVRRLHRTACWQKRAKINQRSMIKPVLITQTPNPAILLKWTAPSRGGGQTMNQTMLKPSATTGSVSHGGAVDPQGPTVSHLPGDDIDGARRNQILREEGSSFNPTRADLSTPATNCATSTTSTTSVASREGFSTSTPIGQHYPNQRSLGSTPDREYYGGGEEEEEEDWEDIRGDGGMGNAAGSFLGYSQLVYENNMEDGDDGELEELYVPIAGYEVMEQRAKFTVSFMLISSVSYFLPCVLIIRIYFLLICGVNVLICSCSDMFIILSPFLFICLHVFMNFFYLSCFPLYHYGT